MELNPPNIPTPVDQPLAYMRSASINFNAKGLKPNTRVHPFFDGQLVSDHCRSITATSFGEPLITDTNGELSGVFRIPAETFKTGTRIFTLINNSTDPTANTDCVAITTYTSYGAVTYDTAKISSTRAPNITFARSTSPRELSVERTVTVNPSATTFKDPIAQTFFVSGQNNGIFITKIDVYFKTRPSVATVPITLQIRTTTNGNPGTEILPFSTVTLYPKDVNASADASAPTQFTFESPVYLKNNEEYAMVLLPAGGREGYEVWTAVLGQNKIGTEEKIDKQPAAGRLYVSSNSVNWTVSESADMKFTVYRANFNVSSGTLLLKNKKIDYLGLSSISGEILVGDTLTGVTSGAVGTVLNYDRYNAVAHTQITSGRFSEGETIQIRRVAGTGASDATAVITLTPYKDDVEGKLLHRLASGISFVEYNDSSVSFEHKIYNSSETEPATFTTMKKEGLFTLGEEKTVYSHSFESNTLGSGTGLGLNTNEEGSVLVKVNFATNNSNISPIVDITKSQIIGYEHKVRSVRRTLSGTSTFSTSSTIVTGKTSGDETAFFNQVIAGAVLRNSAGKVIGVVRAVTARDSITLTSNAAVDGTDDIITVDYEATDVSGNAKYHTRFVSLPTGQEADDLLVFLDANIPAKTNVLVYAKVIGVGDTSDVKSRPWTQMIMSKNSNSLGAGEFVYKFYANQHDYETPVGGLNTDNVFEYTDATGSNSFKQFTAFAVKIIMTSTDSYYVPSINSMRALALMA
jgi:hypothetical protein